WEYACHEGNTIVANYVTTSRYERAHPTPDEVKTAKVPEDVASALAGRWVGRARSARIDLDIVLEVKANPDGTRLGRLWGGTVGKCDKPLRDFTMNGRVMNFELPNTQPWTMDGELSADGSAIAAVLNNIQGNVPVTFRKTHP